MTEDYGLSQLVLRCASAILAGDESVLVQAKEKLPKGFPRGTLLAPQITGVRNYAACPVKVLKWVHENTKKIKSGEKQ